MSMNEEQKILDRIKELSNSVSASLEKFADALARANENLAGLVKALEREVTIDLRHQGDMSDEAVSAFFDRGTFERSNIHYLVCEKHFSCSLIGDTTPVCPRCKAESEAAKNSECPRRGDRRYTNRGLPNQAEEIFSGEIWIPIGPWDTVYLSDDRKILGVKRAPTIFEAQEEKEEADYQNERFRQGLDDIRRKDENATITETKLPLNKRPRML